MRSREIFIAARGSHGVIPPFYSLAVAMAAYEMGYLEAAKAIIEPTNASRVALKKLLAESGMQHIIGKGYYAFMNVGDYIKAKGWADSEPLGQYLAENHGIAIVPVGGGPVHRTRCAEEKAGNGSSTEVDG